MSLVQEVTVCSDCTHVSAHQLVSHAPSEKQSLTNSDRSNYFLLMSCTAHRCTRSELRLLQPELFCVGRRLAVPVWSSVAPSCSKITLWDCRYGWITTSMWHCVPCLDIDDCTSCSHRYPVRRASISSFAPTRRVPSASNAASTATLFQHCVASSHLGRSDTPSPDAQILLACTVDAL